MKKKRITLPVLLLAALLLFGCAEESMPTIAPSLPPRTEVSAPSMVPADTETPTSPPTEAETEPVVTEPVVTEPAAPPETEAPETEPIPTDPPVSGIPDAMLSYVRNAYAGPLFQYHTALTEQWTEGDYFDHEMSSLGAYYYDGDPLENVGFTLIDLDSDGIPELIIGAIAHADVDPALFEIWTIADGEAVKVVEGHPRNRYTLEYHPDQDLYMIHNHASSGAANFAMYYYRLQEGSLVLEEGILFDATANADSPWFYTTDEDWNPGNDTEIYSDTALELTESHQQMVLVPDYWPFSLY